MVKSGLTDRWHASMWHGQTWLANCLLLGRVHVEMSNKEKRNIVRSMFDGWILMARRPQEDQRLKMPQGIMLNFNGLLDLDVRNSGCPRISNPFNLVNEVSARDLG